MGNMQLWENMLKRLKKKKKKVRSDATIFVRRQQELQARLKPKLLWDSFTQGTYRRSLHGELT